MERFEVIILKKKIALREHLKFFIVNSKEKSMTGEISLSAGRNCYESSTQPPCRCFETILVCEENEFDDRIFALLKQQRERPEFFQAFLAAA